MERLVLIAGNGTFPLIVAQRAKVRQVQVIAFAIKGDIPMGKLGGERSK